MFRKLHIQMTMFCTVITGAILAALTIVCLLIAERSLKENSYASFLNETNSAITHLQAQNTISLQWLNQLREKNGLEFALYLNGTPLFSQQLTASNFSYDTAFPAHAIEVSKSTYGMDIFSDRGSLLSSHTEFSLSTTDGIPCYISAGNLPKGEDTLSFLIFFSLESQQQQIVGQRIAFTIADLFGILLLVVFSWFFTGRMIVPLEAANRRQTEFIASASHELRSPLAVISSGLEAFDKSANQTDRTHFTHIMKQETKRMQHLVSEMLLLANSDTHSIALHPVVCQPDELLLSVYEKYELLAHEKKVALRIELPDCTFTDCTCDTEHIKQVLSILLDNALTYTPASGTVTLSCCLPSTLSIRQHFSNQNKIPAQASICFLVTDTGPGIEDARKDMIFERFYRAEDSHTTKEHFGLGLCIAKEIMTAHHGTIFVMDAPLGGSCFTVVL